MPTDLQKYTIEAIVNIFETGLVLGDYANVTLLKGDAGHLTYGRSQTTLASGNLFLLIRAYVDAEGAEYAASLSPFLSRLENIDYSLDTDFAFRNLLREAGADPVMHQVQDAFFDRAYWVPALTSATRLGIATALGQCTVYDSMIHGSWAMIRDRTNTQCGTCQTLGENLWITRYISVRRQWLSTNSNSLLHNTVYRMVELGKLVDQGRWNLDLPLVVRGVAIDEASLQRSTRASAQVVQERLLSLRSPMMSGADVEAVQKALAAEGYDMTADGVFGPATSTAVTSFQKNSGLTPDGIVGSATRAALGL